jgi:hypothetical protein
MDSPAPIHFTAAQADPICGAGSDSLAMFGNDPNSLPSDGFLDSLSFLIAQIDFAIHAFLAF